MYRHGLQYSSEKYWPPRCTGDGFRLASFDPKDRLIFL